MNKLKRFVYAHPRFVGILLNVCNRINPKNKLRNKGAKLISGVAFLQGLKIISSGTDNRIVLGDFVRMKNCTIIIKGSGNTVTVGDGCVLNSVEMYMEDDGNTISIGTKTEMYGPSHLAVIEGTKIKIGDSCLFSSDLHIRTGDSHSLLDMNGERINPSKNVIIDDHVWIGTRVTCLKGVYIAADSVVAATTTLCKQYSETNAVISGVPGRIIRTGVSWCHDRM